MKWVAAGLALGLGACSTKSAPAPLTLLLEAPPELVRSLHETRIPPGVVLDATRSGATLIVRVAPPAGRVDLEVPGACPVSVDLGGAAPGSTRRVRLAPWLTAGSERTDVGFDRELTVELTPGCREALAGRVTWRQLEGPQLALSTQKNGFMLVTRTRALAELRAGPLEAGLVPLSPRTRGAYRFEATWSDGRTEKKTEVRFSSAPRASGLPSLAIGQRVLLGGASWRLDDAPPDSHAALEHDATGTWFRADRHGRYLFVDGGERELAVTAGTHSGTPLDCARSDCHVELGSAAAKSPMTTVLARAVRGELEAARADCTLSCHAAGEPGLPDGGFVEVARVFGWVMPREGAASGWDALPRALRRVGGVTCTACHGPGTIPERGTRWTVLRSDVCATCHDAPPRYGHVVAWQRSRMARSDADPRTRSGECARCHTTAGFLAAQGAYRADPAPPADTSFGIACAACHAPHAEHSGSALLREPPLPAGFPDGATEGARASRVCLACHASPRDEAEPRASAGNLLYEIGPLSPEARPPHALPGGCIACHGRSPAGTSTLGEGHDFAARPAACLGCHAGGAPPAPALADRARALLDRAGARPHTSPERAPARALRVRAASEGARRRVLAALLMVAEDPAAGIHNPRYGSRLLDWAERELDGAR
ncbi:MAG: hypothetical protein OZ928_10680 [Polyangiaceae bacterium]|nr:hypothetical protein [Polyangiaceae bacterium]